MRIGIPELIILAMVASVLVLPILLALGLRSIGRRAKRLGYASWRAYLAAPPRSDAEKRDAADLVMKGIVLSFLGLLFPAFVLLGMLPLFYGGRKLMYASMGLGLVDDAEQPRA